MFLFILELDKRGEVEQERGVFLFLFFTFEFIYFLNNRIVAVTKDLIFICFLRNCGDDERETQRRKCKVGQRKTESKMERQHVKQETWNLLSCFVLLSLLLVYLLINDFFN